MLQVLLAIVFVYGAFAAPVEELVVPKAVVAIPLENVQKEIDNKAVPSLDIATKPVVAPVAITTDVKSSVPLPLPVATQIAGGAPPPVDLTANPDANPAASGETADLETANSFWGGGWGGGWGRPYWGGGWGGHGGYGGYGGYGGWGGRGYGGYGGYGGWGGGWGRRWGGGYWG